jgi:hypothetical protein
MEVTGIKPVEFVCYMTAKNSSESKLLCMDALTIGGNKVKSLNEYRGNRKYKMGNGWNTHNWEGKIDPATYTFWCGTWD